jgi:hypothetical protein
MTEVLKMRLKSISVGFLPLFIALIFCQPVLAQQPVRLIGGDNSANPYTLASPANPIPVAIEGSSGTPANVNIQQSGSNLSTTNPIFSQSASLTAANQYLLNGTIPATATTITFTAASGNITISTSSGAAILYVNPTGTAATTGTGNFPLFGGGSYSYVGAPLSTISIIGASASGTYGIWAH